MKTIPTVILFIFTIALLASCSKKEGTDLPLHGKWQMREVYNGYVNGGNFQWSTVPVPQQNEIEFFDNGTFIQRQPTVVPQQQCSGTFQLINNKEIQLISNCAASLSKLEATITPEGLIITYLVREGEIKEKYKKVN